MYRKRTEMVNHMNQGFLNKRTEDFSRDHTYTYAYNFTIAYGKGGNHICEDNESHPNWPHDSVAHLV
jgi:hypothetical protein